MQSNFEMAGIHHQRNQQPQMEQHQQQQQQRFIVENASTSSSPFFPINTNYHHFSPQQQQHPQMLEQIHHLPFTQQFLQYQHPHYRSIIDQQQQQQHQEIRPLEPSPEYFPLSFKLGMEESSNTKGGSCEVERKEDALIRGSEQYCTEARQTSLAVSHCWQNQEDSAIKQPFWKQLCAEYSNGNNNNNSNESENKLQEVDQEMYRTEDIIHHGQQHHIIKSLEDTSKCRVVFGELEAIYATKANADNATAATTTTNIHRIASESVLTAEDLPMNNNDNVSFPMTTFNDSNQASGATAIATTTGGVDIGSESASVGGKEEAEATTTTYQVISHKWDVDEAEATKEEVHKRKRRKKVIKEGRSTSNSMANFFESLVKKLATHQENLQRKFMETIERLDRERKEREEAWREQELAKVQKEAAARAHERNLALSREATLVSYLEKLTGQKINFHEADKRSNSVERLSNKRWPQAEVDALVQIRTSLESKFQETGSTKGVLWEEISKSMASMGFNRSARRCKEKWENMHKCIVKKTKEITREQLNDGNNSTFDHENSENKNGSGKEDIEELKEGDKSNNHEK